MQIVSKKTSDAGSQYRCGRVGRGIQPPSTPQPTPNTQTYTKSIENARFPTFQLDDHGPTDGRTDKASYTVRLIKKITTFRLVLYSLYSTNQIVIYERFKELQKMNNLPPVPSNLINLFGFYVRMMTNVSKPKWENNRFFFIVYRGQILLKLLLFLNQLSQ